MSDKIICLVRGTNGKRRKYVSKNGANFKGRKGDNTTYNAPKVDNFEVFETEGFLGTKRVAFYRQGQQDAIPLDRKTKWNHTTNHDSDIEMLVKVTRDALIEAGQADAKANASLAGIGAIIIGLIIHHLWS